MARSKKTIDPNLPTTLAEAIDRLEDPKAALTAIVDRAVRVARDGNYCDAFEDIMGRAVPELAVSTEYDRRTGGAGSTWVDSDGVSCSGHDREGYKNGFHWNTGTDREGYLSDGFHAETGLDRDGFDRNGDNPADPSTRYRFDRWGMDVDGFNSSGGRAYYQSHSYLTRANLRKARDEHEFVYDRDGRRNPEVPVASE